MEEQQQQELKNTEQPLIAKPAPQQQREVITIGADSTYVTTDADGYAKPPPGHDDLGQSEEKYRQKSVAMNYARAFLLAAIIYYPGYYMGIMNPLGGVMTKDIYKLKTEDEQNDFLGNANLFISGGAMLSYFFIGPLANFFGRVRLVMLSELLTLVLAIGYIIHSIEIFYAVRFVSGLVVGILSGVLPITVSEMFPSSISGPAGCFCYFSGTTFGLLGYLTPYFFGNNEALIAKNYKWILIAPAFFGVAHLAAMCVMFKFGSLESPTYFLNKIKPNSEKNRELLIQNLEKWLSCVYVEEDVHFYIDEVMLAQIEKEQDKENPDNAEGLSALIGPRYRFRFLTVIFLNIAQQLSGINFLIFFSTALFNKISHNGREMTIVIGAANIMGGVVGIFTISRFGRRFNMMYGTIVQIIGFSLLIVGYHFEMNWLLSVAVVSYMISFAVGLGGTMGLFCAEIVPATAVGIGGGLQWLFTSLVGKLLPGLNDSLGPTVLILFFIAMMVLTVIYINYACIETMGLSREDTELIYKGGTTEDGKNHHFSLFKFGSNTTGKRRLSDQYEAGEREFVHQKRE